MSYPPSFILCLYTNSYNLLIVQLLARLRLRHTQVLRNSICTRTRCTVRTAPDPSSSTQLRGCTIGTTATPSSIIEQKSRYRYRNGRSLILDKFWWFVSFFFLLNFDILSAKRICVFCLIVLLIRIFLFFKCAATRSKD